MNPYKSLACAGSAVLLLAMAGCATRETADADLARAKLRVEQAQQTGAGEHAAVELQASVDTLRKAEAEAKDGNTDEARRLAKRAELDAELAEAKARRATTERAAQEVKTGTEALQSEAERALVNPPAPIATPTKESNP